MYGLYRGYNQSVHGAPMLSSVYSYWLHALYAEGTEVRLEMVIQVEATSDIFE